MSGRFFSVAALVFFVMCGAQRASASMVTFESLTLGTTYNGSGYSQGDLIFSEDGIDVTIEEFLWSPGNPTFGGFAMVASPSTPVPGAGTFDFGSGQLMGINNISLEFDFTNLGFAVDHVTVNYANNGGNENVSVNGGAIESSLISNAPANIAPGVTLATSFDNIAGYWTLDLTGPIDSMRIGGQEFAIDNVIATPEPSTLVLLAAAALVATRRPRRR